MSDIEKYDSGKLDLSKLDFSKLIFNKPGSPKVLNRFGSDLPIKPPIMEQPSSDIQKGKRVKLYNRGAVCISRRDAFLRRFNLPNTSSRQVTDSGAPGLFFSDGGSLDSTAESWARTAAEREF